MALDVLDHDDGIVDHDTYGENQAEQRQGIDRKPAGQQHREGADNRDRDGHQGNDRGAPGLQEQNDDNDDQDDGFEQRVNDGVDGLPNEHGGVIDDAVVDALGEILLQVRHGLAHGLGKLQCVGVGGLKDRDGYRVLVAEECLDGIFLCAQLDPRNVAQADDLRVLPRLDDDVAELIFVGQSPLSVQSQLELRFVRRRSTDLPGRHLHILLADGVDNVTRRQVAGRQLLRIQPDAHRIVTATEYLDVSHSRQAGEHIADIQDGVVAQV